MRLGFGFYTILILFFLLALRTSAWGQSSTAVSVNDSLGNKKNHISSFKEEKNSWFNKKKKHIEPLKNDSLRKQDADSSVSIRKKGLIARKDELIPKKDTTKTPDQLKSKSIGLVKNKLGFSTDSTKRKLPIPKLNSKGTISVGYDYGVIPFMVNNKTPAGYFKTEGNVGFEVFKLPLIANFYYADVKNVSGLNNYFRVSFDANQYKENLKKKNSYKEFATKDQLTKLYNTRQELDQKLLYFKSIQNQPDFNQLPKNLNTSSFGNIGIPSDTSIHIPSIPNDSLSTHTPPIDTAKIKQAVIDSLSKQNNYAHKADSVNQKIKQYEQEVKETQEKIQEVQKILTLLQNPDASQYLPATSKPSIMNIFSYVKKLEIGLCYPNYSTFLINGSAVKGVNIEMQKSKTFFAFTYGKTINNLLFSNNIVQNNLQNTRNLYNFFDFNNVKDSRRITSIKVGFGGKDETHLHVGFLYGIGQSSYVSNSDLVNTTNVTKEKNYVFELDGKYVVNQNNSFDAVYGKSSLQQDGVTYPSGEKGFASIFNSNNRSNAALVRYNLFIPVTKSRLTFTSRLIDPFFRSYGVGFIRSDNFRYEVKLDQPLTRKIKIGASYRKDQDNILNMYLIKTTLQTIGSSITFRVTKQLTIRVSYNPVLQKVRSKDNSIRIDNRNYISNAIVTWTPKLKKINSSFNVLYNYYQLYDGIRNNVYQNYSLANVTSVGIFKNELSANQYITNNTDTINGNVTLLTNYISLMFKKVMITGGGKFAQSKTYGNQVGYKLKVNVPLNKNVAIEASGEKIVIGDFYNSYSLGQVNKFPYYCYGKLIINW